MGSWWRTGRGVAVMGGGARARRSRAKAVRALLMARYTRKRAYWVREGGQRWAAAWRMLSYA